MISFQLILGLLLTVSPFFELRGGLPLIIDYALKNGFSIWPYFILVLTLNIVAIFFVFIFLDYFHMKFMEVRIYRRLMGRVLLRLWKKVDLMKERMEVWGYFALMFIVAVPIPGTGAWMGALIAWSMKLDRAKSFIAIAFGVVIAGFLVLFASLSFLS